MASTDTTILNPITPEPESPWRMPGFFAATVVATAMAMGALATVAGPAPSSPTPAWSFAHVTYPITVATAE
jgi:hypothetical protein